MPPSPARTTTLIDNLFSVRSLINSATSKASLSKQPRLVAVSKLKPASDILALHESSAAHMHFGENYLQELQEKARLLPKSIKWHFIGGLQSNKALSLARDTRALWAVESVDSEKKASLLDKGWGQRKPEMGGEEKLRVFVQVNTSGEESKSGVDPNGEAVGLCRFILDQCPRLRLQGLMTIGAIARSKATTPDNENEDFICLREARDRVVAELGLEGAQLELSMGMSSDFEGAVAMGSNEIRVGTTIFGGRPPKSP
ncbi:YggS family pyridoxal phosphate enzyme [Aspergillus mulundensis]|uniref:Pyridoxal phosphate homeostasis protein n=1 Tax=Aspergillus mulundensis TaxID=1810919 RepID=A0A3D8QZM3_9EURO|nr:hypothetical protein DSM5745_09004 [Aspergillus mulundensis]RDW67138.1 hypothetical protein DSM5745_09004 [Aspergillus mulundensis]